jgi:hypothetical protein
MQPLRERTSPTSPIEAEAIGLLRAAERYEPPPDCRPRVRARLVEQRAARRVRALRPVLALAMVLFAAGASAAVGRHWIARTYQLWTGPEALPEPALSSLAPAPVRAAETPHVSRAVSEDVPPPAAPVALAAPSEPSHPGVQSPEQVRLVFDAMRALRREGQPERASRLLDEYLRRYPGGSLAEEALALSIEAAIMRGDGRAKDLANRYLSRYPVGHFRPAAERARARFAP